MSHRKRRSWEQPGAGIRPSRTHSPPIKASSEEELRQQILFRLARRIEDYEKIEGDRWIADDIRFALERLLKRYPNLIRPKELNNGNEEREDL